MKTLLILFIFIPLTAFAQNKYQVVGDTFFTTICDGRGKDVPVSFTISEDAKEMILASDDYKTTQEDEAFLAKNKEVRGIEDFFTLHLFSLVNTAAFNTSIQLKTKSSFTVEEGAVGTIYVSKGRVALAFPFQGQNSHGNMVHSTSITTNGQTLIANQ